ncbi:MAG: LacI family DNA-binding transcriptional regulator, partial [Lewinella sp.]|nr:LacI family DNA-binding transcriptional regulator [Lewinella sp.]
LKDHPDISQETIDRVKQVAEELGYRPNLQAISFRSRKSRLIGLIIPDMNMYFFPAVIQAIEEKVRQEGYNLLVLHSNNTLKGERENTQICDRLGVEGLLVSVSAESEDLSHFRELTESGVPVVLFDRIVDRPDYPLVCINDQEVAGKVVEYLYSQGRHRICGAFDDPHLSISSRRREGYEQALQRLNLPLREEWIFHANSSEVAQEKMIKILQLPDRPDAIFSMSDQLLVGIMQACLSLGLHIPEDITVAAISNGLVPNFWQPPIPFMQHSGKDVGTMAAEVLFRHIRHQPVEHINWVDTRLRVPSSVSTSGS